MILIISNSSQSKYSQRRNRTRDLPALMQSALSFIRHSYPEKQQIQRNPQRRTDVTPGDKPKRKPKQPKEHNHTFPAEYLSLSFHQLISFNGQIALKQVSDYLRRRCIPAISRSLGSPRGSGRWCNNPAFTPPPARTHPPRLFALQVFQHLHRTRSPP